MSNNQYNLKVLLICVSITGWLHLKSDKVLKESFTRNAMVTCFTRDAMVYFMGTSMLVNKIMKFVPIAA